MTLRFLVEAVRSGLARSDFNLAVDRLHLSVYEDVA